MALTNAANGTLAADGTEQTLTTETSAAAYQLVVDLSNMASGDTVVLKAVVKTLTGSTAADESTITFTDAQTEPVFVSKPIAVEHSIAYTLEQTAGTNRNYDWSVGTWPL